MENFFISLLDENFGIFGVVATLGSKKKMPLENLFFACIAHSYLKVYKNYFSQVYGQKFGQKWY